MHPHPRLLHDQEYLEAVNEFWAPNRIRRENFESTVAVADTGDELGDWWLNYLRNQLEIYHCTEPVRSVGFSADPEGLRKVSGGLVLSLGFTTRPSQQQTATPTPLPYTRQITGQSWRRPTASRLSLTTAFVVGEVKQHFGTGLR